MLPTLQKFLLDAARFELRRRNQQHESELRRESAGMKQLLASPQVAANVIAFPQAQVRLKTAEEVRDDYVVSVVQRQPEKRLEDIAQELGVARHTLYSIRKRRRMV